MSAPRFGIGMMIGTSLDGIDAALVSFDGMPAPGRVRCVRSLTATLPDAPRLRAIAEGAATTAAELSALRFSLAASHAAAARDLVAAEETEWGEVDFVACHGVTLCHDPAAGHGWQLSVGAPLAARLGVPVVDDFRAADIARGGQGAPLAPLVDFALRRDEHEHRVILNLGGIANLTVLPAGVTTLADVLAADVGPANLPLDQIHREATGEPYDRDGGAAQRGSVLEPLRAALGAQAWMVQDLPRSFGREEFGPEWVDGLRALAPDAPPCDLLRTLVEVEAEAVARLLETHAGRRLRDGRPVGVYLTGGGRHNRALFVALERRLHPWRVAGLESLGEDPDAKEAVDFAVLGAWRLVNHEVDAGVLTGATRGGGLGCLHSV